MALGELPDGAVRLVVETDRDELREAGAGVVEHAEGAVGGVDEVDRAVHDPLQHRGQIEVRADREDGIEELAQAARPGGIGHGGSIGRAM